jgi:hypothetical protein
MSSVLRSKINSKQSTSFYVNEVAITESELYDDSGNPLPDIQTFGQPSNKVQVSYTNDYTELYCNALSPGGDWNPGDKQYAYSTRTIGATDVVTVIFTSPQSSTNHDFIVGFGDAANVVYSGNTYNIAAGFNSSTVFNYGFYFWQSTYAANSVFKMEYDGAGSVKLYANDTLVRTTNFSFNSVFPNGMKLFTIFNDGGGTSREFTVRFSNLSILVPNTNPARSLFCRNMGKQYVISDSTYLKVRTLSSPARNFYIKFNNTSYNKFVSYNL